MSGSFVIVYLIDMLTDCDWCAGRLITPLMDHLARITSSVQRKKDVNGQFSHFHFFTLLDTLI